MTVAANASFFFAADKKAKRKPVLLFYFAIDFSVTL